MTQSTFQQNTPPPPRRRVYVKFGMVAAGFVAAGAVTVTYWLGLLREQHTPSPHTPSPPAATVAHQGNEGADEDQSFVAIPADKLTAAGIQIEPVSRRTLTQRRSVPGRVEYNHDRHIELTAPTGGILTQVLVKPGDCVRAGQVLAWLNSPEIGAARADVLQRMADAGLAEALADRAHTLEQNVVALTKTLKSQPEFNALSQQFAGRLLGDYRKQLLAAYSQMQLAESLVIGRAGLAESGVLSGRVIQERQNAARAARAELEAACEQAGLDVWKERSQAEATARDAQRRVEIARQQLASLLLDEAATRADGGRLDVSQLGANDDDLRQLSRFAVRAPFAGTIEIRKCSASERVRATDAMFVLADTTSLWINAEIRENDWPAVAIQTGQALSVTVPALGDTPQEATVEFIGREVASDTNAIPIVAVIDNSDERLRPGLFVRVSVPIGVKPDVLTVPTRSVLQHEGQTFVFLSDGENRFRRVDVVSGEEGDGQVEIVSGLNDGDQVVTHGAFVLKSELLLEGEEE